MILLYPVSVSTETFFLKTRSLYTLAFLLDVPWLDLGKAVTPKVCFRIPVWPPSAVRLLLLSHIVCYVHCSLPCSLRYCQLLNKASSRLWSLHLQDEIRCSWWLCSCRPLQTFRSKMVTFLAYLTCRQCPTLTGVLLLQWFHGRVVRPVSFSTPCKKPHVPGTVYSETS